VQAAAFDYSFLFLSVEYSSGEKTKVGINGELLLFILGTSPLILMGYINLFILGT
jgi:hypothetical protein